MFTKTNLIKATLTFITLSLTVPAFASSDDIKVSDVPAEVIKAAENAVQGIDIKEAELEKHNDSIVYELEGYAGKKEYKVKVDEKGNVLKVEEDD